ncbi:hypothetical protein A2368_01900 [Candidatus Collierbacteria bacterium RIFOXYB1_FULL_49_13]|uniref:Uncharacterized protein n=1 Tax=Candidatus Collierbacteria bacterium RIFOXYB1_FULL_49_13 TaxID=1817728 RepID=A0A1F5FGI2_9BACT|nr:MAG: hypothetical protein A2368_01900 [Candidatus Collierbacteria bacterium RIFOXYB1_FULL_49_13]
MRGGLPAIAEAIASAGGGHACRSGEPGLLGILYEPGSNFVVGIWKTGARQYFVSPATIASTILDVRGNIQLQDNLRLLGQANARKYSWDKLRSAIVQLVEKQ